MKFGLSQNILDDVKAVLTKYHEVEQVIIYGSRAIGNYRDGSDIDLTLKGQEIDLHILSKIVSDLDDLLIPYKFDISIFHEISNKDLLDHINTIGLDFYNK